jgi:hypothetical protein
MSYSVDQSIFVMVVVHGEVQVLCCEQFMLCKGVSSSCYARGWWEFIGM